MSQTQQKHESNIYAVRCDTCGERENICGTESHQLDDVIDYACGTCDCVMQATVYDLS